MEVLSRGWSTDLTILALSGCDIQHRSTHVVVRTPENPSYRWGNFLLLRRVPLRQDLPRIEALFERELPGVVHRTFGIDAPDGTAADLKALAEAGYDVGAAVVLTASAVSPPPRQVASVEFRPIRSDEDWEQRVTLELACRDGQEPEAVTRLRVVGQRLLSGDGYGSWYGAFDAGRLLATIGIVRAGSLVVRFQDVRTHPEARGRGLASTLAYRAASDCADRLGAELFVAVVPPDDPSIAVYRRVGFSDHEVQLTAERGP